VTSALATAGPYLLIGGILIGIIVYAIRQAKIVGKADQNVEDADARARFNRKLADRRPAKDLDELRRRAARRRNRE
jgi:hypothetical protein